MGYSERALMIYNDMRATNPMRDDPVWQKCEPSEPPIGCKPKLQLVWSRQTSVEVRRIGQPFNLFSQFVR
jgi:hypothetical protein